MLTVEIALTHEQFSGAYLMEMRSWLDSHRYEPHRFVYELIDRDPVVFVDFKVDSEAKEFAAAFEGAVVTDSHTQRAQSA